MTPYFSKIKDNRIFQFCVVNIIILNAVLIGATTYNLDPLFLEIINYLDYGITIFFVVDANDDASMDGFVCYLCYW